MTRVDAAFEEVESGRVSARTGKSGIDGKVSSMTERGGREESIEEGEKEEEEEEEEEDFRRGKF